MKLGNVVLIDDDEPTNYVNQVVIKRTKPGSNVVVAQNGLEGLELLQKKELASSEDAANLILLDLNMPKMNGWEFLEEYSHLPKEVQEHNQVYILSTSSLPFERLKAKENGAVKGMLTKPLTPADISQIVESNFAA